MPTFPLAARPSLSYHEFPRSFGSLRNGGKRKHAGCDLSAPPGTPVLACLDGKIIHGPYLFYDGVYALEVQHGDGSVIRYGEIAAPGQIEGTTWPVASAKIVPGYEVKQGQCIAFVGKIEHLSVSMLHFEMYTGVKPGPGQHGGAGDGNWTAMLTDTSRPPFMRRVDLVDPTAFLDSCALAVAQVHPTT